MIAFQFPHIAAIHTKEGMDDASFQAASMEDEQEVLKILEDDAEEMMKITADPETFLVVEELLLEPLEEEIDQRHYDDPMGNSIDKKDPSNNIDVTEAVARPWSFWPHSNGETDDPVSNTSYCEEKEEQVRPSVIATSAPVLGLSNEGNGQQQPRLNHEVLNANEGNGVPNKDDETEIPLAGNFTTLSTPAWPFSPCEALLSFFCNPCTLVILFIVGVVVMITLLSIYVPKTGSGGGTGLHYNTPHKSPTFRRPSVFSSPVKSPVKSPSRPSKSH